MYIKGVEGMKAVLSGILWRGATAVGAENSSPYKIKIKTVTVITFYHPYLYKTRSHSQ